MGIHDIQFPTLYSGGTRGGPGFRTAVRTSDSGVELRTTEWGSSTDFRIEYEVAKDVQTRAEISEILSAHRCMRGGAFAFRFHDETFWSTAKSGRGIPTDVPRDRAPCDPPIGNGSNGAFKLQTGMADENAGFAGEVRRITRPKLPSDPDAHMALYWNGTKVYPGIITVAVDYDNGRIVTSVAPPAGVLVEAAFTFDVPARFAKAADEGLGFVWDEAEQLHVDGLRIQSLAHDKNTGPEEHEHGGASVHSVAALPSWNLDLNDGQVQRFEDVPVSFTIILPDVAFEYRGEVTGGGPFVVVENFGGGTLSVVDKVGFIASVTSGQALELWYSSAQDRWRPR